MAGSATSSRRGIAVANYVEFTTGSPREWTKVSVLPEGRVDVAIGTLSSGQGHATSFTQLIPDWLGVPFDCVRLIQGDTDIIPVGGGSHSGRSMRHAGTVIVKAVPGLIEKTLPPADRSAMLSVNCLRWPGLNRSATSSKNTCMTTIRAPSC